MKNTTLALPKKETEKLYEYSKSEVKKSDTSSGTDNTTTCTTIMTSTHLHGNQ